MTTTIEQPSFVAPESRQITTPHGFCLYVPLQRVHPEAVRTCRGTYLPDLLRQAEESLQQGYPVRFEAPASYPAFRLSWRFYGRSLSKAQVRALARLKRYHDRHPEATWAHLRDFGGPSHGDWGRLRHWCLIEPRPMLAHQPAIEWRGWWKLTGLGHLWLRGLVKVPRRAALFDGVFVGWMDATDLVGPDQVDDGFSLDRILSGAA